MEWENLNNNNNKHLSLQLNSTQHTHMHITRLDLFHASYDMKKQEWQ